MNCRKQHIIYSKIHWRNRNGHLKTTQHTTICTFVTNQWHYFTQSSMYPRNIAGAGPVDILIQKIAVETRKNLDIMLIDT